MYVFICVTAASSVACSATSRMKMSPTTADNGNWPFTHDSTGGCAPLLICGRIANDTSDWLPGAVRQLGRIVRPVGVPVAATLKPAANAGVGKAAAGKRIGALEVRTFAIRTPPLRLGEPAFRSAIILS